MNRAGRLTYAWTCGSTMIRTLLPHLGLVYGLLLWSTHSAKLFREAQAPGVVCIDGRIVTN